MLKNSLGKFPVSEDYYSDGVDSGEIVREMNRWKTGLEKELRVLLRSYRSTEQDSVTRVLEEILGEE
jgi:hypothetical protein